MSGADGAARGDEGAADEARPAKRLHDDGGAGGDGAGGAAGTDTTLALVGDPGPSMEDGATLVLKMLIPTSSAGGVIGKGGENINNVRKSTNCKVVLSESTHGAERIVSVCMWVPLPLPRASLSTASVGARADACGVTLVAGDVHGQAVASQRGVPHGV